MKTYRSGWIRKHTGLSRRTMESYVRRGYIHPQAGSTSNNYRGYSMSDIETAWKIKQLITIGYTHAEISDMLKASGTLEVGESIQDKIRLLEQKRAELSQTIAYARRIAETGTIPPIDWRD